jgi:uncharacterized protein YukE
MVGQRKGVDVQEMERLHAGLDRVSGTVDQLRQELTQLLAQTEWWGNLGNDFRDAWEKDFQPALKRMSDGLQLAGRDVRTTKERFVTADQR